MTRTRLVCIGMALAGLVLALSQATRTAQADTVTGTNAALSSLGGNIFIPFAPADSGRLGDVITIGKVGFQSDSVTRTGVESSFSGGNVWFILDFTLPKPFQSSSDPSMQLQFSDLDFATPPTTGNWRYKEEMDLAVLAKGASTPPGSVDLHVDSANYQLYNGGAAVTDHTSLTYDFSFRTDLGQTQADINSINADLGFTLYVKFYSLIEHNTTGTGQFFNTDESVANNLVFVSVPEPATLAMLALGGAGFVSVRLRRRRAVAGDRKSGPLGPWVKAVLLAIVACAALAPATTASAAIVGPITFAPADYDNTANTVTSGPTTTNNQTTGKFRDVIWWSLNNGQPRVGSADFINQGKNLVLVGNSAVDNGTGAFNALNFTGPSVSGGQSYLSIYDTTPADGPASKDVFSAANGLVVSADVLFVKHNVSGGVVALYNEGQDALALLASNGDGANLDVPKLNLVWQSAGTGTVLQSTSLAASAIVPGDWYRVTLNLTVTGDAWSAIGTIKTHLTPTDPTTGLDSLVTTLTFNGLLSDPNPAPGLDRVLKDPGEIGIMAMGNESISLPDNVGVSVTNFTAVPEPATLTMLALGAIGTFAARRFARKREVV